MSERKQIRVTLPADMAGKFEQQKSAAEKRMAMSLSDAQFAAMIITHGIKVMEEDK